MKKIISIVLSLGLILLPNMIEASTRCSFYQFTSKDLIHQLILYIDQDEGKILLFKEYNLDKKTGEWTERELKEKEELKLSKVLNALTPRKFEERGLDYKELEVFSKLTNINLNETKISCDGEIFKLKYKDSVIMLYVNEDSRGRLLDGKVQ